MAIVNGYATLAQVRAALGTIQSEDTTVDSQIELDVEAASRQIDDVLGYRIWQDGTVKTREFYAESPTCCDLYAQPGNRPKAGISTTTGLVVKIDEDGDGTFETTLTIDTDFVLLPRNAEDELPAEPYTEIVLADNFSFPRLSNGRAGVQVTAQFGWPAVPDWAEKACILQATALYKAKDAAFGIVMLPEGGGGMRPGRGLVSGAKDLIEPNARPSVG